MRHLKVRQMLAAKQAQLFGRGGGTGPEDNEGLRRFTPFLMRQADDGRFLHGGMTQQYALDLDGRNVLASGCTTAASPV